MYTLTTLFNILSKDHTHLTTCSHSIWSEMTPWETNHACAVAKDRESDSIYTKLSSQTTSFYFKDRLVTTLKC